GGRHGSEGGDAERRARATRLCLAALQQTFSESQGLSDGRGGVRLHAANPNLRATITIALCTTGDSHLVPYLEGCPFNHIRTNAEPRYLGFECHKVLRSGLGRYDWFGYLEDDLRLADGLFFQKLAWFNREFGDEAVLQANRFEIADEPAPYKLYIDGNLSDPTLTPALHQMEPLPPLSFDEALGRRIIALYRWAVDQGLRGSPADRLFEGFCERLAAAGVPLTRAFAGMRTLHPQWAGYAYTWLRDRGAVEPAQIERGEAYEQDVSSGPFGLLIEQAPRAAAEGGWPRLRRRLAGPAAQLDFPVLARLAEAGVTDYFAQLVSFANGDPARGQGIGYSFATDRPEGFGDDDILLIQAVLPAVSL